MDLKAHYQALFDAIDGVVDVPVLHVFSGDSQTGTSHPLPYVVYSQEVERVKAGTPGSGSLKVMKSNWLVTAYAYELGEALNLVTAIVNELTDNDLVTSDGYTTTHLAPTGVMTLWEKDGKNYAVHLRMEWERSL